MLDVIKHVVHDNFVFQQESTPVYCARNAIQRLQCEILFFLSAELSSTRQATVDLCCLQDLGSHLVVNELQVNKIEEIMQRLAKQQYSV